MSESAQPDQPQAQARQSQSTQANPSDQPDPYNAVVVGRTDFNEELAEFRVAWEDGRRVDFEPGQFATLGIPAPDQPKPPDPSTEQSKRRRKRGPKYIRRAYSIGSSPKAREHMAFYVVRVDEGKLTPHLWPMDEGDRLFMGDKITGHFTLEGVPSDKNFIMVGTGTGLAPYRAMYHNFRYTGRWNRFILFDGCRYVRDLGYLAEMQRHERQDPSFTYLPSVTREPEDASWPGLHGRVTSHLRPENFKQITGLDLSPQTCHVFLCGNPNMIDQLEETLTSLGFVTKDRKHPDGNIHLERYW